MIFCQDAAEQRMDDNAGGDTIAIFPIENRLLEQWIGNGPPNYGGLATLYGGYAFDHEWYRHGNYKRCHTMWVDGHLSAIKFTGYTGPNAGIDWRAYTGETLQRSIPD